MSRFVFLDATWPDKPARTRSKSRHTWHNSKGRAKGVVLAGLVVLSACDLALTASEASACGATPEEAYPLLPYDGWGDVPQNAVLLAATSINGLEVTFELQEMPDAKPLSLKDPLCEAGLCSAELLEGLSAHTAYRYRVRVRDDEASSWVQFETKEATDTSPIAADGLAVEIRSAASAEPEEGEEYPCGYFRTAEVLFEFRDVGEPSVVVAPGAVPDF